MKAARYYGPGDVRVEKIAEPEAEAGQVKVKIAWNGICGSDLHAYLVHLTKPDDLAAQTLPFTLGHEFSGTIVDIGDGIDGKFKVGQHVVMEWEDREEGSPIEVGAMIEPLAVAWHAMKRGGFKDGQSVLVLGAGPIGLFLLKILRHEGHKWGSVDIAFDTTGIQAAVDPALKSIRPHGTFVNVAIWEQKPIFDMNLVVLRELTVTGSVVYHEDHAELLGAVAAGKLQGLEDLVTRKIALEDVVNKGIKALINEKDKQIKILVHP
ncbi:hypothetical protein NLJ89_g737 [Agrocybe chaxingu]|uniref:Enoyl reductase (ER) domain-containing protein n=1 Tax=Agrocybe chaxingu TaxID=84603 RepID=A0A9W8N1D5_9AGAR|nr:hypothetical protein NLJ89_g737 [Agrocybe chaxingu]